MTQTEKKLWMKTQFNLDRAEMKANYAIDRFTMDLHQMTNEQLNAEYNKLSRTIAYSALDTLSIKKMIALKEKADDWEVTLTYEDEV